MPPISSSSSSSKHHSRSGKPLSLLNAGSELSASSLLAASAQASEELERILKGDQATRTRERNRNRAKSPHKAVLVEEDPFLVHTIKSSTGTSEVRSNKPSHSHSSSSSSHHHRISSSSTSSSSRHRHRSSSKDRRKSKSRSSRHGTRDAVIIPETDLTSDASSIRHRPRDEERRRSRSRHQRSRSTSRHRSQSRRRSSSPHRHRSKSRSLSRTRQHYLNGTSSSSHHISTSHHHHRHPSSSSATRHRSRTRSRSHSRNRYPDGYAPPLQAVGGGIDQELRSKFIDPFEYDDYPSHHHRSHRRSTSPPLSPSSRAAYDHRRLLELEREEYEYRLAAMNIHGREPYSAISSDARRPYEPYPRRDYGFESGPLGPDNKESDETFELDDDDRPKPESTMSPDMTWAGQSNVLICALCQSRYEEPGSSSTGSGGKVPRYLLCGHTYCTACLTKQVDIQADLALATDTGTDASGVTPAHQKSAYPLNIPCPSGNCGPTPVNEHGALSLPINQSYLDVAQFLRSRRAAGYGLKDTGIGRGDERSEAERIAELNAELSEDARVQSQIAQSYGLAHSLPCQQCSVHIAALYCQSCHIRYCAACSASVHVGRALADHVKRGLVLPLNVARARGLLGNTTTPNGATLAHGHATPALMCPTHADQPLTLYCRTCQQPVCRDCITPLFKGKHLPPGHDVDLLATVLQGTQTELKTGVQSLESTISRLEKHATQAASQVTHVATRIGEVRSELKDAFALIRASVLKALAERESKLESELLAKSRAKESKIHAYRADLAKLLNLARAAHEEGVRVLQSSADESNGTMNGTNSAGGVHTDIFAIKALLDVRAAINAGTSAVVTQAAEQHGVALVHNARHQDVLLRVKPRELIRLVESQISKAGGVIASLPSEPSFVSFQASGTSMVLTWAPSNEPVEGEVFEYTLEVCELPRGWRSKLRLLQPSLFPPGASEDEDKDEDEKWDGQGPLGDRMRAAVNWLALPAGQVNLGGAEMIWKIVGGAGWAGAFSQKNCEHILLREEEGACNHVDSYLSLLSLCGLFRSFFLSFFSSSLFR